MRLQIHLKTFRNKIHYLRSQTNWKNSKMELKSEVYWTWCATAVKSMQRAARTSSVQWQHSLSSKTCSYFRSEKVPAFSDSKTIAFCKKKNRDKTVTLKHLCQVTYILLTVMKTSATWWFYTTTHESQHVLETKLVIKYPEKTKKTPRNDTLSVIKMWIFVEKRAITARWSLFTDKHFFRRTQQIRRKII